MPQLQLPIFYSGAHLITAELGYLREENQIIYMNGMMPVFTHEASDIDTFKMIVSQFYITGLVKQADIVRAFGINPLSLKRWVKKYREGGPGSFFTHQRTKNRSKKSPYKTSGESMFFNEK
jgi:hypothetical protein